MSVGCESIVNLKNKIQQLFHENRELKEREKKHKLKILNLKYKLEKLHLKYDICVDKSEESDSGDDESEMIKRSESKINELFDYFISNNQTMKPQDVSLAAINESKAIASNHSVIQSPKVTIKDESVVHKTNSTPNSNRMTTTNPKVESSSWKDECLELIDTILEHPDSAPFREPISLRDYPNYKSVIKEPIDFGTIREKLINDEYKTIHEFDYDCNLVFINSETYFTNKKSKIYAMTIRLLEFYDQHIETISNNHQQQLKIQPCALPKKTGGGDIMNELLNLTNDHKRDDSDGNNQQFKAPEFFFYRPKNRKNSNPQRVEHTIKAEMESTRNESDENEKPVKQDSKKELTPSANPTQKRNRKQFSYKEASVSSDSETDEDSRKQTTKQTAQKTNKKQRRSDAQYTRHANGNESGN